MISIALPIHNMDRAEFYLMRCLDSITEQTYEDFEVVITDNSPDDRLYKLIRTYGLHFIYHRNKPDPKNGIGQNTNEAISRCSGEIIKILYMDDYFAHKNALKDIVESFKGHWLISATDNNKNPRYTHDVHIGNNKLGSPSAMTIQNLTPMLFDPSLHWLIDCDYYKRMYEFYGEPTILKKVNVCIGVHEGQTTNILTDEEKEAEVEIMKTRYV